MFYVFFSIPSTRVISICPISSSVPFVTQTRGHIVGTPPPSPLMSCVFSYKKTQTHFYEGRLTRCSTVASAKRGLNVPQVMSCTSRATSSRVFPETACFDVKTRPATQKQQTAFFSHVGLLVNGSGVESVHNYAAKRNSAIDKAAKKTAS